MSLFPTAGAGVTTLKKILVRALGDIPNSASSRITFASALRWHSHTG
jgi:hypothetical protein